MLFSKKAIFLSALVLLARTQDNSGCPQQIGGCYMFPPNDELNRPIETDPVDFRSSCIIANLPAANVRLDFGFFDSGFGIPITTGPTSNQIPLTFGTNGDDFSDESDCYQNGNFVRPCIGGGTIPIPLTAEIESSTMANPDPVSGDRHVLYVDSDTCFLHELFATERVGQGWQCSSSAIWNLTASLPQRPEGFTSADAAGLPIAPLLLRVEEVNSGEIRHPLRFTSPSASRSYSLPASHFGPNSDEMLPWYGMRIRLRANFSETGYDPQSLTFIRAMKRYGLIYADQGSAFFVQGVSSDLWTDTFISNINSDMTIPISEFEVVQPPFDVVYGFAATPMCNGLSSNSQPFVPDYNPVCDDFSSQDGGQNSTGFVLNPQFVFVLLLCLFAFVF